MSINLVRHSLLGHGYTQLERLSLLSVKIIIYLLLKKERLALTYLHLSLELIVQAQVNTLFVAVNLGRMATFGSYRRNLNENAVKHFHLQRHTTDTNGD